MCVRANATDSSHATKQREGEREAGRERRLEVRKKKKSWMRGIVNKLKGMHMISFKKKKKAS